MKSFQNKVAAITGAGSGIGRALALNLAGQGCALALSDVNLAGLAETAKLAEAKGVKVSQTKVDVASKDAIYAWAEATAKEYGKVNLIFNNAGVALGAAVDGMKFEDFRWIMDINFWGVVHGTQAFLPHLKASGDGHIINISSLFGLVAVPSQSAYNASKFAVRGFTEALRMELDMADQGVSSTCVHPGGIKTNIARAARFDDNMKALIGQDADQGKAEFEKLFITTPEAAAATILKAVRRDSRRVLLGPDAVAVDLLQRLLPGGYQRLIVLGTKLRMKKN
ncbi:MAG: SDR family oxidoreductase [Stagnimonas sp.]|nr:SDR family oxidoreductase [Stagnimonas sp.]